MTSRRAEAAAGRPPVQGRGVVLQAHELRSGRIESLRGLAALAVLEGHVWLFAQAAQKPVATQPPRLGFAGGLGLVVFFALSGYLLFKAFARHHFEGRPPVDIGRYARNRALRILPLYFVVIVVLLLLTQHGGTPRQWLRFATLTQGFFPDTVATVDGPAWSLVVEVHYYLLLPLLAWAIARLSHGNLRTAALLVGALMLAGVAARLALVTGARERSDVARYNLPTNVQYFAPGMLLALLEIAWRRGRPAWLPGVVGRSDAWLLVGAGCWLLAALFPGNDLFGLLASFLTVGGCALEVLDRGVAWRVLEWRPLTAIGLASYSIYLWHLPLLERIYRTGGVPHDFLPLLLLALLVVGIVAAVSYRGVEEPFLRLRRSWST